MQTIKEYVLSEFEPHTIKEITVHGMVSGFGQLIYYSDTCAFHDKYEEEIWDMLENDRDSSDCDTILELITLFSGSKNVDSMSQLKNLLCWYAVESVCVEILNDIESNEVPNDG